MRFPLVLLLAVLCFLPASAADAAADKADAPDDSWLQEYYRKPSPERFEAEVRAMQKRGFLHNDGAIPPIASFFSRLFHSAAPEQLAQWLKVVDSLPEQDRQLFLLALRMADTPAARDALKAAAAGKGDAASYAKKVIGTEQPDITKLTSPAPEELDMCWGAFFATGDAAYALTVLRCAVKPVKPKTIDLSQQAARWSYKSLSQSHPKLREIRDDFYKTATPEERKTLDEVFKK